jgi:hypothetical protein
MLQTRPRRAIARRGAVDVELGLESGVLDVGEGDILYPARAVELR